MDLFSYIKYMEKWKPVVGYEDLYEISSNGRLCSITKVTKNRKIMKYHLSNGYERCNIVKDGITKKVRAHKLVAEAFIPNPENHEYVHHINGVRTDNKVENLQWVTHTQNLIKRMFSVDGELESKERLYNYITTSIERNKISTLDQLLVLLKS